MKTILLPRRLGHRAPQHSIVLLFAFALSLLLLLSLFVAGCGGSLPRPKNAAVSVDDYIAVPFTPRPPPVEFVPPSPNKDALWVDGTWEWATDRYVWRFGAWMIPPDGARRTRWVIVRREVDGQLFFAPSLWKDASGKSIDDRSFAQQLGPRARARSRPGGGPPTPPDMDAITTPPPSEDDE